MRKRSPKEVIVKRSLTQIRKRWPKCCPTSLNRLSGTFNMSCGCTTDGSSTAPPSSKQSMHDTSEGSQPKSAENSLESLTAQLASLETKFDLLSTKINSQNIENCVALEDFTKFKKRFEKAQPILEKLQNEPENSSPTTNCISDEEKATRRESGLVLYEIQWLKDRLLEISESLNLQSQCLSQLKCEDFPRIKSDLFELMVDVQGIKSQTSEHQMLLNTIKCQDSVVVDLRRKMERAKEKIDEMSFIIGENGQKLERIPEIFQSQSWSQDTTTSNSSEVIDIKNLQKSEDEKSKKQQSDGSSYKQADLTTGSQRVESALESDDKSQNTADSASSCKFNGTTCYPSESYVNRFEQQEEEQEDEQQQYERLYQQQQLEQKAYQISCGSLQLQIESPSYAAAPKCDSNTFRPCTYNCVPSQKSELCPDALANLQKRVSSHDCSIQRLLQVVAVKINRCEVEALSRQLSRTTDAVMKMRNQMSTPSAAGVVVPLIQNANCIFCQATTNMSVFAESIPKAPELKFGRQGCNSTSSNSQATSLSSVKGSWMCSARVRRSGGSHTLLSRAMEVRSMRLKRLKTPARVISSLLVCKNRFRRQNL